MSCLPYSGYIEEEGQPPPIQDRLRQFYPLLFVVTQQERYELADLASRLDEQYNTDEKRE